MPLVPYGGKRPPLPAQSGYRGGSLGVEKDFGIRDRGFDAAIDFFNRRNQSEWDSSSRINEINAQGNNAIRQTAAGLTTEANKGQARGDLQRSLSDWGVLRDTGGMTDDEFTQQTLARSNRVRAAGDAAKQNFNTTMAARGLGGNAGAMAALGMSQDFAAAGELGLAEADLQEQRRAAKERGLQGYSGVSSELAQIALTPTQEAALRLANGGGGGGGSAGGSSSYGGGTGDIMSIARQFMNMDIGPDGFDWNAQQRPDRPVYNTDAVDDPWNPQIGNPFQGRDDWRKQRPRQPQGRRW